MQIKIMAKLMAWPVLYKTAKSSYQNVKTQVRARGKPRKGDQSTKQYFKQKEQAEDWGGEESI